MARYTYRSELLYDGCVCFPLRRRISTDSAAIHQELHQSMLGGYPESQGLCIDQPPWQEFHRQQSLFL